MIELKKILDCFKPAEVLLVKEMIRLRNKSGDSKKYQLLELLENEGDVNDACAIKAIYENNCSPSAFSHLKERLKEDLLDLLHQKGASGLIDRKVIWEVKARKLYIKGLLLYYRDLREIALPIFYKTLKICNKYELFDLKLAVYEFIGSKYKDAKITKTVWKKYKVAIAELWKVNMAKYNYYNTFNESDHPIFTFKEDDPCFSSKNLEFWYYNTATRHFRDQRDFSKAYQCSNNSIELINKGPDLFSQEEKLQAKLDMAKLCIHQQKFEKAISLCQHQIKDSESEALKVDFFQVLFYGYFYNQQWLDAHSIIKRASSYFETGSAEWHKWRFYLANLKFGIKEFKSAMKILNEYNYRAGKDHHFKTGNRLLEILILLELKDYDWLNFKMDSFRKLIRKARTKGESRMTEIYKLLLKLTNNDYNYDKTLIEQQQIIDNLKKCSGAISRDPLGFEIIDFSKWFGDKISNDVKYEAPSRLQLTDI